MKTAVGLADLARLFHRLPAGHQAEHAAGLGFRAPDLPVPPPDEPTGDRSDSAPGLISSAASTREATNEPDTRMPFWRVEAVVEYEPPPDHDEGTSELGLTWAEIESRGFRLSAIPPSPPLAPWSTLWSRLRSALHGSAASREPDVAALVRSWARGDSVGRIPRLARRAWAAAVTIWVDRSERLIPFWSDQDEVCREIGRLCGPGALDIRMLDDNLQAVTWQRHGDLLGRQRPNPAAPLLVLGDLGSYGGARDRERWEATARRVRRDGVRVAALVPCSPLDPRWDRALAGAWNAMPWERATPTSHALNAEERMHRLLRLVAPTFLAQPGLVRALRRLLPAAEADVSTEVDVWQHSDVAARDVTGLILKASTSERLRAELASLPRSLQADVAALIERWHRELPPELLHAETLAWRSWSATEPPGDLERAKAFARRVTVTGWTEGGDDAEPGLARDYGHYLLGAVGDALYHEEPALKKLWSVTHAQMPGERRPATIAAHEVVKPGPRRAARWWALYQRGDALMVVPALTGAWPGPGPCSTVATFAAAEPTVWVRRGDKREPRSTALEVGAVIRLQPDEPLVLDTDQGSEVTLDVWERAPWAVAAGRDRYGLWAAFEVQGVQQRMRWIPPGRFLMGSPLSEAGRDEDEGPQHWVTITQGYWLGETPVTQALWWAVMTKNPSRFVSDDRPVEQVSWDDCQAFIGRLNERLEGLETRLPTEAEWERACRAGTTTATWVGDLTLRGENDVPELDAIAWYGGNSGVEFELKDGEDSNLWPRKQYRHSRAGTRPVGHKAPNPYGLHDMLGNLFEWCQDADLRVYTREPSDDPVSTGSGSSRVNRGGSWYRRATRARAAFRDENPRDYGDDGLGLRLAGGDVTLEAWKRAPWAVAAGRDRYGLWAVFEVGGVQQRMRWIPPGRFLMGSLPSEAGRWDDEGPQHEVTITKGYWLGETPVTQALWRVVMTNNPSQFVSDNRPVETVSWNDCQVFIGRLNERLEGLETRLPTEAEWERACRAGTTKATWVGDLTLRGENDALELDAIAWYGGNSGVNFELDDGYDSRAWPEKQHPHTRAGTHPVGRKAPNPYGLHDMLGNVFEWCQDAAEDHSGHPYASKPVVDPVSSAQGSCRVFRGGSWYDDASDVRAALRCARAGIVRVDTLGFRLAGDRVSALRKPSGTEMEPRSGARPDVVTAALSKRPPSFTKKKDA